MLKPTATSAMRDLNMLTMGKRRDGILIPPIPVRSSEDSVHMLAQSNPSKNSNSGPAQREGAFTVSFPLHSLER